jgi:hypothetical protein
MQETKFQFSFLFSHFTSLLSSSHHVHVHLSYIESLMDDDDNEKTTTMMMTMMMMEIAATNE